MQDFFESVRKGVYEDTVAVKSSMEKRAKHEFTKILQHLNSIYLEFESLSAEYGTIKEIVEEMGSPVQAAPEQPQKEEGEKEEKEAKGDEEESGPPLIKVWKESFKQKSHAASSFFSRKFEPLLIVFDNLFRRQASALVQTLQEGRSENSKMSDEVRVKVEQKLVDRFSKIDLKKLNDTIQASRKEVYEYLSKRRPELVDIYISGFDPKDFEDKEYAYYLEELDKQASAPKSSFFCTASASEPETLKAWTRQFFDLNYDIIFAENKKARDIELYTLLRKYKRLYLKIDRRISTLEKLLKKYDRKTVKISQKYAKSMREYTKRKV